MKQETKQMTQEATEQTIDNVNSAIELSQKTANAVFESTVKTAEVANGYMQNMFQVGLDAQESGVNVARNYFDSISKINRQWINLFANTGERTINTAGDTVKNTVNNVVAGGAEIVDNAAIQAKRAGK